MPLVKNIKHYSTSNIHKVLSTNILFKNYEERYIINLPFISLTTKLPVRRSKENNIKHYFLDLNFRFNHLHITSRFFFVAFRLFIM
jgi:hypothetical protein